ncbi:hypothetical protein QOT17_015637 [Balamuthia mandrillaris]
MEGASSNEYVAKNVENFKRVKEMVAETSGWTEEKNEGGAVLYSREVSGSPLRCYKVVSDINATPKELAELLYGFKFEEWNKMDSNVTAWRVVEEIDDKNKVIHQVNKLPWPLWARDVCIICSFVEENGTYYLVYVSVDHPQAPRDDSQYVRADLQLSGYVFAPSADGQGTTMTRVIHLDAAGNIPSSVINSSAKSLHGLPAKIRAAAGK